MELDMEEFDDDVTTIQLRHDAFDQMFDPPALPFPLVRRKDGLHVGAIYELTALAASN